MGEMQDTKLYQRWYKQVCQPPRNDYIMVISASSRTPVSGTGKTTKALGWAKSLDQSEEGFDAESQATLDAEKFANDIIPNAPDHAAVLMDEAQGTPGGGSGMNRMRAMSQSTLDAVGSLLANRDKMLTVIIVVQQFHMLFGDFYPMIDSWLMITDEPAAPAGPRARHHLVYTEDYELKGANMKTPVLETIGWPAVAKSDPDYMAMEEKKQRAKTKGGNDEEAVVDEDASLSDAVQERIAQQFRDMGKSPRWIAENVDEITYSYSWIYEHTEDNDQQPEKETA